MKIFICVLFLFSFTIYSQAHESKKSGKNSHSHSHREHGSHQHGVGQAGLVFEGNQGKFELIVPAESIIGFEHEAKNEKDIKIRDSILAHFETKFSEMVVFDKSLNCSLTKEKIEIQYEKTSNQLPAKKNKNSSHSDFVARYIAACDKSPLGTEMTIDFHSHFKKLKKIELQFVLENLQKSLSITKPNTKFNLK
jgi:hypothetical protein